MTLRLTHVFDDRVAVDYAGRPLFRYVYVPRTDPFETPKPYFHPVHTLAGNLITNFRPYDHLWHYGIAMTFAHVNGQNFWGGNNYVHGQGYQRLPHLVGRQEHRSWEAMRCDASPDGDGIFMDERLTWLSYEGESWLDEARTIAVRDVNPGEGYWALEFTTTLTSVATAPIHIGSPTTIGRPNAGYGSFVWRGPRSFLGGTILAADGLEGPDVMGQRAPWLAFIGKHDGTAGEAAATASPASQSTLVFVDQPSNPRYPTKWFVRNDPFACVSFAVTFDEEIVLQHGQSLALSYRILIADGVWSREQIEAVAGK